MVSADELSENIEHFVSLLDNHLQRLMIDFPQISSFLDEYFGSEQIAELAPLAAEKMQLTQSDGEQHSFAIKRRPVCYFISTLPLHVDELADWFAQRYGGYFRFLERIWNTPFFRAEDCPVFCHIIYGWTRSGTWVHMALCPVKVPAPMETMVLPVEFLTPEERSKSSL